jgi:hypothetical protein
MSYFPSSQIKTNLYTNGGELTTYLNQSSSPPTYVGSYYIVSNGKKYTGKTPSDGPNIRLYEVQENAYAESSTNPIDNPDIIQYDYFLDLNYTKTQNINLNTTRYLPKYNPTSPTQKDYDLGAFQRYFCKKNNELIYIEIDKNTFNLLQSKSSTIAWDLYTPLSTLWYIKGNKEQTYKANKGLITLIEQNQKWYGFTQWFQDKFLKYYLES